MPTALHALVVATAIVAGSAAVAVPAQSQVRWKTPPAGAEIPQRALEDGVSGTATVSCTATAQGVVDNCQIESESPEGYSFGQAAAQYVQSGILEPSVDGQPIGPFRVRIPFNVADAAPAPLENPSWRIPPRITVADFPQRALNAGASGGAIVQCNASAEGVPENCIVLEERPERMGFGEAAVRIVQRGRLNKSDAWLPGARFTVRIPFTLSNSF